MKDFMKKLLIINILIIGIAGTFWFILAESSCCGFEPEFSPVLFIVAAVVSIIYSLLFVLIDLIRPSKIKYALVHTSLYIVFLMVSAFWNISNFFQIILGDYWVLFSPIPFLLIHLIYVLYKKSN